MTEPTITPEAIEDTDLDQAEGGIIAVLIGYQDAPVTRPGVTEHVITHEIGHD